MIKVVAPRMAQNVVDRAMQVCFGTLQTIQERLNEWSRERTTNAKIALLS